MSPTLHMATLGPHERSILKQFEVYIRKTYGMSLAVYLLLELEDGRASVLEKTSAEFKGMTKWQ